MILTSSRLWRRRELSPVQSTGVVCDTCASSAIVDVCRPQWSIDEKLHGKIGRSKSNHYLSEFSVVRNKILLELTWDIFIIFFLLRRAFDLYLLFMISNRFSFLPFPSSCVRTGPSRAHFIPSHLQWTSLRSNVVEALSQVITNDNNQSFRISLFLRFAHQT